MNIQVELSQALTDLDREFNLDNINPVQDIKDLKVRTDESWFWDHT